MNRPSFEHFRNLRSFFATVEGGIFLRKMPLECMAPICSHSENAVARPWLLPLAPLYRLALGVREFCLGPARRLRFPVVSIGNLSAGGAGKTPLTIALAQALSRRGIEVDVLSRGYGRAGRGAARVEPGGTAEEFGDEPLLIARRPSPGLRCGPALGGRAAGRAGDRSCEAARLHVCAEPSQRKAMAALI